MGGGKAQNSDEILEQKADLRVRVQRKPCDKFREMARERGVNTKAWRTLRMRGKENVEKEESSSKWATLM